MNYGTIQGMQLIGIAVMILFIISAVIAIAMMIKTHGEIKKVQEEIKNTEKETEQIRTTGISDKITKIAERMGKALEEAFNGKVVYLQKNKIYYLGHPCTTGSESMENNKKREEELFKRIIKDNPEAKIIRPLTIIPEDLEHEEAMARCFSMIDAADGLIFPADWEQSRGCKMENERGSETGKEIIYLKSI